MVRVALVALVLCWSLLAAAQSSPDASTAAAGVAMGACSEEGGGHNGDGQWSAPQQTSASITESAWKFPNVHARLARGLSVDAFVAMQRSPHQTPDRTRPSPGHLLRIPLLI